MLTQQQLTDYYRRTHNITGPYRPFEDEDVPALAFGPLPPDPDEDRLGGNYRPLDPERDLVQALASGEVR
jgi:hypothetical protein